MEVVVQSSKQILLVVVQVARFHVQAEVEEHCWSLAVLCYQRTEEVLKSQVSGSRPRPEAFWEVWEVVQECPLLRFCLAMKEVDGRRSRTCQHLLLEEEHGSVVVVEMALAVDWQVEMEVVQHCCFFSKAAQQAVDHAERFPMSLYVVD